MGSRFGDVKGYNEDGTLNPVYAGRMGRIIEAADRRGMIVLVGCLYWSTSKAKWDELDAGGGEQGRGEHRGVAEGEQLPECLRGCG